MPVPCKVYLIQYYARGFHYLICNFLFREKEGDTFAEKATAENVDKKTKGTLPTFIKHFCYVNF